jgi:hypothetical protein
MAVYEDNMSNELDYIDSERVKIVLKRHPDGRPYFEYKEREGKVADLNSTTIGCKDRKVCPHGEDYPGCGECGS